MRHFGTFIVVPKKHNKERIKKVQEEYNLGDLFIIEYTSSVAYLSLKVVKFKRLQKILKASQSLNYVTFLKYGYNWIRLSGVVDNHKNIVKEAPKYKGIIESNDRGPFSRPHLYMVNTFLDKDRRYDNLVGIPHHTIKTVKIKCHQTQ